ncbi:error-prone DNA polymerase [Granulosicoccus antarcticus]|uniref:Error-prone DNA polymerase n=1 Tax=Granulosicoccus antarcticus IMCC3135 TaxID=1192854 RepID=A0A2Z2NY90_9GAMM|nr:error-prone DNA polymerase [Granulosicoccus antarcticus]ASJ74728.1 Error-prone DNA polymerase [Granulosicoccus antarcticus IMCC3135]
MDIQLNSATPSNYAELHCVSNFSFLRGASRPEELIDTALRLGYSALAITDECSMAGVVRAYGRMKELASDVPVAPGKINDNVMTQASFKLIVGSEFALDDGFRLVVLVRNLASYARLCQLITNARRSAAKGSYQISPAMINNAGLEDCCLILVPPYLPARRKNPDAMFSWFDKLGPFTFLALELHYGSYDQKHSHWLFDAAERHQLAIVAAGDVHMHERKRRALQDIITCIRHTCTLDTAGRRLFQNGEHYLRDRRALQSIYPAKTLQNACDVAALCHFDLAELDYQYPREVVPADLTSAQYLRKLTLEGAQWRWPNGHSIDVQQQLEHELSLISEMQYESYFLTVHDIVRFARSQNILCQGRGSAANSAVCYCLGVTEVDPSRTRMLFERFISKERNEPPDIDIDFEHERREEVIQYIYAKYGRHRAALAATVITYRKRSAIRDLGKAMGLLEDQIEALSKSMAWWDGTDVVGERLEAMGFDPDSPLIKRFTWLLQQLLGFPRHLSQHVGGFVISDRDLSTLVPVENAAMPDRTIIQWDKDDLEELGLLKVDVLALGMLTAIAKCFKLIESHRGISHTMAAIPVDDTPTYDMICRADTIGVFQIESRAQMSMLPRLRPRSYYDLVIEISIVRPGPIQGGMVNPYLQRRQGIQPISYPNKDLERVLERTLGVPIFQEQVMEIAMVAAGFSAGQADELRRSMAAWRRGGQVARFHDRVVSGMLKNGYDPEFAEAIFRQIEGFGEYGFPESHAASFALLVYVSCWLKCHEPAAFLCAMLNSQPLGFYDPSDLTQDARRHGVNVLPVDVNQSDRDHKLVIPDKSDREQPHITDNNAPHTATSPAHSNPTQPNTAHSNPDQAAIHNTATPLPQAAVRLGFRLVSRLSSAGTERLLAARAHGPFTSAADLVRRSGINQTDQQALAIAGALENISGDRHQAQWDLLGVEALPELLADASAAEPCLHLPEPTEGQNTAADYMSMGLTLDRHPLSLLRERLTKRRILDSSRWAAIPNGRMARIAGLVKVRQRPGTANGVIFLTIEDEGGPMNVIVWSQVAEIFRKEVLGAQMVSVHGVTQREQGVSHLVARKIEDLSWMLGELTVSSRDFH